MSKQERKDYELAVSQARQLKNLLKHINHAEDVLSSALGAVDDRDRYLKEVEGLQGRLDAARVETRDAEKANREAKEASTKRIGEIKLGLNKKVKLASEEADTELTTIANRVAEALHAEEATTKEITKRIYFNQQREAGVTASCNEAEARLRRLQAELAKL